MPVNRVQIRPDIRPIGADGTYLIADASQPDGVRWGKIYPTGIASGFTILSLLPLAYTLSNGSIEIMAGTGLVNPIFSLVYSYTASGATITAVGSGTQVDSSPFTTITFTGTFTNNTVNASQEFIVTASGEGGWDTDSITVYWRQVAYWGVMPTGGTVNEAFIKSLSNSGFRPAHSGTMNLNGTSTGYLWYSFRQAAGTPVIRDSGSNLNGGWQYVATVSGFTNAAGFTDYYDVWRSDYPNLGNRTYVLM